VVAARTEGALTERKRRRYPWHGLPHLDATTAYRIVTGTCFEHRPVLAQCARRRWFESELLAHLKSADVECAAWVILPNHYHVLVRIDDIKEFAIGLGRLYGRTSFEINREDDTRGRRVWYRSQDRCMRSQAHFYTSINYIHNNPLKHGHVKKWTDWPCSSIHWYLQTKGRDWLLDLWRSYPVLNYGAKWDV
jgi:putative transposase